MVEEEKTKIETEEAKVENTEETVVKEEVKKGKKKEIKKKDVAVANGYSLRISPKQCIYVCRIIKGKSPEAAIARLQAVIDEKRPVPMAGLEVAHKKGKGLAGGRFPKNACKGIMDIVKQVRANAITNGIEDPVVTIAKSDKASAPFRRSGTKGKRAHIHLEVRSRKWVIGNRKQEGKK